MRRFVLPLLLIAPACTTVSDKDWTKSGFRSVSGGEVPASLTGEQNGQVVDTFGAVYFVTGMSSEGAVAYAGIDPSTDVGGVVSSGTATLNGSYEVVGLENIYLLTSNDFEGTLFGSPFVEDGLITLSANFSGGTLTGSAGQLSVNGAISGGTLSGGVTFAGDSGTLTGQIGTVGAVGAFHGNDDDRVFAGGFVVETPD